MLVSISASMENEPEIQLLSLINFYSSSFAGHPTCLSAKFSSIWQVIFLLPSVFFTCEKPEIKNAFIQSLNKKIVGLPLSTLTHPFFMKRCEITGMDPLVGIIVPVSYTHLTLPTKRIV